MNALNEKMGNLKKGLRNRLPGLYKLYRTRYLEFGKGLVQWSQSSREYNTSKLVHAIKREANFEKGRLLDIGCLESKYKALINAICEEYYGLDIEKRPNVDIVGTVYNLPFKERSFQKVTLLEVLEHLSEPDKAFKETSRILDKNGILLITVPQYWHIHGWPSDYFRYTIYALEYYLEKHNFVIEQYWNMGGPFLIIYNVLCLNFRLGHGPISRILLCLPLLFICSLLDRIFFRNNLKRKNPDTVGWSVIARKVS